MEIVSRDASCLSLTIPSDTAEVNGVLELTKTFVAEHGHKTCMDLLIVLRELLMNAIVHGNRLERAKPVTFDIADVGDGVFSVTVGDEGTGFDHRALDMTIPENPRNLRQRGYRLVHALSREIRFEGNGNRITVLVSPKDEKTYGQPGARHGMTESP